MEKSRGIVLSLALAAAVTAVTVLPSSADEKKQEQKNIFTEDEPRGRRPWYLRIDLTDQEISRILEDLRKRNPEKAEELVELRKKEPAAFKEGLRRHGGEVYRKIIRQYAERWRQQRLNDFLEWLQKNYRREARELAGLKNRDPGLYDKKLDEMREKYEPIRDAERRNPELAVVLKDDLRLKERRDELIAKIKTTKRKDEKEKLTRELQSVVAARYDIIVKRKIIAYEQLIRRLEELKDWINKSKSEIADYKKEEAKAENVKQRMKTLLGGKKGFNWGD